MIRSDDKIAIVAAKEIECILQFIHGFVVAFL